MEQALNNFVANLEYGGARRIKTLSKVVHNYSTARMNGSLRFYSRDPPNDRLNKADTRSRRTTRANYYKDLLFPIKTSLRS